MSLFNYWSRLKSRASRTPGVYATEGWLIQHDYLPKDEEAMLEGLFTYLPGEQRRKVVLSLTNISLGLVDDNRMLVSLGPGSYARAHAHACAHRPMG